MYLHIQLAICKYDSLTLLQKCSLNPVYIENIKRTFELDLKRMLRLFNLIGSVPRNEENDPLSPLLQSEEEYKSETTKSDSTEKQNTELANSGSTKESNCKVCNFKTACWKCWNFLKDRYGLLLAILSAFTFATMSIIVKVLVQTLDPLQVIPISLIVTTIGSLCFVWQQRVSLPTSCTDYIWLFLSGVTLTSNTFCTVYSLSFIDAGNAVTILYTSVMLAGFSSWLILKEPLRLREFCFAFLALLGVVFVSHPSFVFGKDQMDTSDKENTLIGVGFSLGGAFSISLQYTFVRKQSQLGIHSLFSLFFNSTVAVIIGAVAVIASGKWIEPTFVEASLAMLCSCVYFVGQCALYLALKVEKVTLVTITLTIDIVFTFLMQYLLLHIASTWTSYVGALLIITACIGISI
ncbi:solute carrier family 35 member G1-like [Apostichopus japonicus]|uniref:solute carrier family 35 member G1-like n=1 Tax=Stichopus japonicus TaxID=307972 RepID=UPI003AB20671